MCSAPGTGAGDAAPFFQKLGEPAGFTGRDLEDVILEEVPQNFAGCFCGRPHINQKWKIALSTIHYAMNEAARNAGKPLIHGSVEGFEGQLATLMPWDNHACYQCLYPEPPPDQLRSGGADNGAAGVTAGLIGTLQAAEVIKLVTGTGQPLIGQLLVYDLLAGAFKKLKIKSPKEAIGKVYRWRQTTFSRGNPRWIPVEVVE